jgi:hypothetical protein
MARDSKSDEFAKSERGLAERLGLGQGVEFAARLEMSMDAALTFLVENDGRDQWSLPHEITIEDRALRVVIEWRFWGDEYWPYDDGALAGEECPCYARFDVIPLGPGACDVRAQWVKPTSDPFYPLFERDMRRLWELGGREWAEEREAPTETDSEGLRQPGLPAGLRIPKGATCRRRWAKIYDLVKPQLMQGATIEAVTEWLERAHREHRRADTGIQEDLAVSPRTMQDVVKWGDAGKPDPPET